MSAAEKALWGPTTLPSGSSAFGLYSELGIDTLQLSVSWAAVAPSRPATASNPADPAYRWPPAIATAAAEADRHGIRLALLVTNAPPWANGGRAPIWAPGDPTDFADFLTASARRYPAVRRWMIWGEPNRDDRFQPNRKDDPAAPRAYASLLDAAYTALKRESPRNRVIGGMTWTSGTVTPRDFVRWMALRNGKRPRLDWFGHNPFPFRFPKLADGPLSGFRDISDTDTFSREVRRAYKRTVPLWLSEYAIQTGRGSDVFATFVSEREQARYLKAGYGIADDLGRRVAGLGWLSLLDEPDAQGSANWGVMTYGLRRKPSFAAFVRAPSERFEPRVAVRRARGRRSLRVKVILRPRRNGIIRVELRRGSRRLDRSRVRGKSGRPRTVRLRHGSTARGHYTVIVRSGRAATVRRNVRVR
ncbi:MAG: hypothetical protein M3401_11510 [Actinomycetota bacterium]|nr:hypothetical protein [Actinomycetota bacterium]